MSKPNAPSTRSAAASGVPSLPRDGPAAADLATFSQEAAAGSNGARPRLLDLFCGAGGAAMGYHRAGFDVLGVDWKPQPHYPFEFIQAEALDFLDGDGWRGFALIHASPPCQGYSIMRNLPWLRDKDYPLLIGPVRDRLLLTDLPYVIENVAGARRSEKRPDGMQAGWLCGGMFGLPFYRHRYFESNWFWMQPGHPRHRFTLRKGRKLGARAREIVHSGGISAVGANVGVLAREAMDIRWMSRYEITQAIPPAYTEYIGRQLLAVLRA